MSKHTQGPWRHQGPDDFWDFNILHNRDSLAIAAVVSNMRGLDEITANARLIAAAPDMLEALDHIGGLSRALRVGGPDPMDLQGLSDALEEAVDLANALVAKAQGES